MTAARCSFGITATSARRPPRNATPKPAPPRIEPARYACPSRAPTATTISAIPAASAIEPALAPSHGAVRPEQQLSAAAAPASADDSDARHDHVRRAEQMRRELGAEREEQAADRPGGDHRQAGQQERAPAGRRDRWPLERQPEPAAILTGSGIQ